MLYGRSFSAIEDGVEIGGMMNWSHWWQETVGIESWKPSGGGWFRMSGLQGSGKTFSPVQLACMLKNQEETAVVTDVYRPAAIE